MLWNLKYYQHSIQRKHIKIIKWVLNTIYKTAHIYIHWEVLACLYMMCDYVLISNISPHHKLVSVNELLLHCRHCFPPLQSRDLPVRNFS